MRFTVMNYNLDKEQLEIVNDDNKYLYELKSLLNDSNIPFVIDINEFDKLPDYFQEEIKKRYIRIF